jgi:hypothetical protein
MLVSRVSISYAMLVFRVLKVTISLYNLFFVEVVMLLGGCQLEIIYLKFVFFMIFIP